MGRVKIVQFSRNARTGKQPEINHLNLWHKVSQKLVLGRSFGSDKLAGIRHTSQAAGSSGAVAAMGLILAVIWAQRVEIHPEAN